MDYINLGKILQEARNKVGLKQSEVATEVGCTSANISSWERGKSKIDIDSFAKLCEIYNIDFASTLNQVANNAENKTKKLELDINEKTMIKKYRSLDQFGKKAVDDILNDEYERCLYIEKEPSIKLRLSLLKASAGTGNWLDDEQMDTITVVDTPEARKADIVIEVDGDSMKPKYNNGDKVLVRLQPAVEIGEVGIFIMDGNGYIKQFSNDRLISLNPEYKDVHPNEYSDFRCIGKVIGKAEIIE